MYLRIEAPHFVAGCHGDTWAPIIAYMRNWPISKIRSYCLSKGWKLTESNWEHFPSETSCTNTSSKTINTKEQMNGYGNNDYTGIFKTVGGAKTMGAGFAPKLEIGSHRLALKSYRVKESSKGLGQYLEAEFVVVESNVHKQGETRGWAWFPNASGQWAAAYEQDRAKKFIEAVGACIGDTSPVEAIMANIAGPDQAATGLIIDCRVTPQTGKNAGKTNSKGEPYTNIFWNPVSQTLDELAASREEVESLAPATPAPAPSAPATTTQTQAPKSLFGRK